VRVRDGMSELVLTVGPGHTLREAAAQMAGRNVGAAVVLDPELPGPGIITERDILLSVARGEDPDNERVSDHKTDDLVFAAPEWSLEQAAAEMVRGRFRHLVVIDAGELRGIISMRDIMRVWRPAI
jgi:CBS domain-containing protein